MTEFYRPFAGLISPAALLAAEAMACRVREDLVLLRLSLRWFVATEKLTPEEWADPVCNGLSARRGGGDGLRGKVLFDVPSVIWCRVGMTPYMTARVVAHEARHSWQMTQEAWATPTQGGLDACEFLAAWSRWDCARERDARAYSHRLRVTAGQIAKAVRAEQKGL